MDPASGELLPPSELEEGLRCQDAPRRERSLLALVRAQAAGYDLSALHASLLPPLVTSEALSPPARRLAVELLRHAKLSGALSVSSVCASLPLTARAQGESASLRFALLSLARSFPPHAAAAALASLPGLRSAEPELRCAAALAAAAHCGSAPFAEALRKPALRALVAACSDAHAPAAAAAFTALLALLTGAGCEPGFRPRSPASAGQALAACRAAADLWAARAPLAAAAAALPAPQRAPALRALAASAPSAALEALRWRAGLPPQPPQSDPGLETEAVAAALRASLHPAQPGLALEAAAALLRMGPLAPPAASGHALDTLLALAGPGGEGGAEARPAHARLAALLLLATLLAGLALELGPRGVQGALEAATALPAAPRRAALGPLAAAALALAARPDARAAAGGAPGAAMRTLFRPTLSALASAPTAQRGAAGRRLADLLCALLLAAAGDGGGRGHPAERGPAWPLIALEAAELAQQGLGTARGMAEAGRRDALLLHCMLGLLARLAPAAAAAGGEAAARTQRLLRAAGAIAGARLAPAAEEEGLPPPPLGARCAALALIGRALTGVAPSEARAYAAALRSALLEAAGEAAAGARAGAEAAARAGSLAAATELAQQPPPPAARQLAAALGGAAALARTVAAEGSGEAAAAAASALGEALDALGGEGGGEAAAAARAAAALVAGPLAAARLALAPLRASGGWGTEEGPETAARPHAAAHLPLPPLGAAVGGSAEDARVRAELLGGLRAFGMQVDDDAHDGYEGGYGDAALDAARLAAWLPPRPQHAARLLTSDCGASDAASLWASHEVLPHLRLLRLRLRLEAARGDAGAGGAEPGALGGAVTGLRLQLVGPLATVGSELAAASHLQPGDGCGEPPPPGAEAWERSFSLVCGAPGRASVHPVLELAGGGILRCRPYRLPLTHALLSERLSPPAFMARWDAAGRGARLALRLATRPDAPPGATALACLVVACDASPMARAFAHPAPGGPPGAGCAAYAARSWLGQPLLLLACSTEGGGASVELRGVAGWEEALAAGNETAAEWAEDLTADACIAVDEEEAEEEKRFVRDDTADEDELSLQ